MSIKVEARYPHRDELGEGPHWDAATNTLLRVDTLLGQVHRLEPMTGDQTTLQLDSPPGFAVSSGSGSVTVGIGHSVQRVDPDGTRSEITSVEADNEDLRFNDGKCDRYGRLLFGSLSLSREPACGLYRLPGDGQLDQILPGITSVERHVLGRRALTVLLRRLVAAAHRRVRLRPADGRRERAAAVRASHQRPACLMVWRLTPKGESGS